MKVAIGNGSNRGRVTKNIDVPWGVFCRMLSKPAEGGNKHGAWHVCGEFSPGTKNNRRYLHGVRDKAHLVTRSAIVLDLEQQGAGEAGDVVAAVSELKRRAGRMLIHSTYSHEPLTGDYRYRVIIPTARDITGAEYESIATQVTAGLMNAVDPRSLSQTQIAYFPAIPEGGKYETEIVEGEALDPDAYAGVGGAEPSCAPRDDPRDKIGAIGEFCRAYSVTEAIAAFLGDIYEPTSSPMRYSYKPAESTGGLVVYDGDLYAYSNHATDPAAAGGHCLNAYDLVFTHKGGDLIAQAIAAREFAETGNNTSPKRKWLQISKRGGVTIEYTALASEIIKELDIYYNGGEFLRYLPEQGTWRSDGEPYLEQYIQRKKLGQYTRIQNLRETIKAIKNSLYTAESFDKENPNKIVLRDGMYDTEQNTFTPGFDPGAHARTKHDIAYDPDAVCPAFEKLIKTTYGEDNLDYIYEWFGYCLYRAYPIHEILILVGKGGTGKSTLLNILRDFVGREACTTIQIKKLINPNDRFSTSALVGKTLAFDDDAKVTHLGDASEIKSFTGGNLVSVERKGKDAYDYANYAKLTFAANDLPSSHDTQGGLGRRATILWTRDTLPLNEYREVIEQIKGEYPGILIKALAGLGRVLKEYKFTKSAAAKEAMEAWELDNDTVALFINECVVPEDGAQSTRSETYLNYRNWCADCGRQALGKHKFNRIFASRGYIWSKKRVEVWENIKIQAYEFM